MASCVLFCPVCCEAIDGADDGAQTFECPGCETKFTVDVDRDIIRRQSLIG